MTTISVGYPSDDEAYYGLGGRTGDPNLRGSGGGTEVQVCHPPSGGGGGSSYYSTKRTSNSLTVPHVVSSSGVSLHLRNVGPCTFDFAPRNDGRYYSVRTPCSVLSGTFLAATDVLHACTLHTSFTGRSRPLPRWTQRIGVIVGASGVRAPFETFAPGCSSATVVSRACSSRIGRGGRGSGTGAAAAAARRRAIRAGTITSSRGSITPDGRTCSTRWSDGA